MLTISLDDILSHDPCASGRTTLLTSLGYANGIFDPHLRVTLGDVAVSNGADDAWWCVRCLDLKDKAVCRRLVRALLPCCRRAASHTTDPRVAECLDAVSRWAEGDDSVDLRAAYTAAYAAAHAAADATHAAHVGTYAAYAAHAAAHAAADAAYAADAAAYAATDATHAADVGIYAAYAAYAVGTYVSCAADAAAYAATDATHAADVAAHAAADATHAADAAAHAAADAVGTYVSYAAHAAAHAARAAAYEAEKKEQVGDLVGEFRRASELDQGHR